MNELREVFRKEREKEVTKESKDNKGNKTDRSDFENIIHLLFNRFKVIRDEKENYETARNRMKSQVLNRDSTTKTHKFDKKTEKNTNGADQKAKAMKNDLALIKDKERKFR